MRLRRSDFYIGSYHKRRMWRDFLASLRDPTLENEAIIAIMLKGANGRGIYCTAERCRSLKWIVAVSMLLSNVYHSKGEAFFRKLSASVPPGWMKKWSMVAREIGDKPISK